MHGRQQGSPASRGLRALVLSAWIGPACANEEPVAAETTRGASDGDDVGPGGDATSTTAGTDTAGGSTSSVGATDTTSATGTTAGGSTQTTAEVTSAATGDATSSSTGDATSSSTGDATSSSTGNATSSSTGNATSSSTDATSSSTDATSSSTGGTSSSGAPTSSSGPSDATSTGATATSTTASDGGTTGIAGTDAPTTTAVATTSPLDTDATTGAAAPVCGDGVPDPGEQCDDGNQDDADACSNDCIAACGLVWQRSLTGERGIDTAVGDGVIVVLVELADTPALVATDPSGVVAWTHLGTPGTHARALAMGPDGSIAMVTDDGVDTTTAVLEPDGTPRWSDTQSGRTAAGVAIAADGAVVVVGRAPLVGTGSQAFVHTYDALGASLWDVLDGGGDPDLDDAAWRVAIDAGGRIHVAIGRDAVGSGVASALLVLRLDAAGATIDAVDSTPAGAGPWRVDDLVAVAGDLALVLARSPGDGAWSLTWIDDTGAIAAVHDGPGFALADLRVPTGVGSDAAGIVALAGRRDPSGVDRMFTARVDETAQLHCDRALDGFDGAIVAAGVDVDPLGDVYVTGVRTGGGGPEAWLARFRP